MSYKNVKTHALGHLMVACRGPPTNFTTSTTNSCLELSCGRAMLDQFLCNMSCIVNDNHNIKNQTR